MRRIYLDYNATTPVAPEVREAMQPFLAEHYGNPSSSYPLGRASAEAISDAREQLASLIGADAEDIVFTSSGTESNNLALKGVFLRNGQIGGHLIISAIEHPAISAPVEFLRKLGVSVSVAPCDANGVVDPDAVKQLLRPDTRLVSVMLANNEIGTIQPIREIAQLCHEAGVPVHTDAAQAVGKIRVDVSELDVDMLTVAGHKLYAPKGVGALFVRPTVDLEPLLHGAAHERGLRAGTENTPYLIGLGRAAKLAAARLAKNSFDNTCRNDLWNQLADHIGTGLHVHGQPETGLPNTLSISFARVRGHDLLQRLPEICASTGAACHSGMISKSPTLAAIGATDEQAAGTIRLSTGIYTTESEVQIAALKLTEAWQQLQA